MSGICPQASNASVTITMDFFDYGPQPAPPVPADATDITSAAQSSGLAAQSSGAARQAARRPAADRARAHAVVHPGGGAV